MAGGEGHAYQSATHHMHTVYLTCLLSQSSLSPSHAQSTSSTIFGGGVKDVSGRTSVSFVSPLLAAAMPWPHAFSYFL